MQYLPVLTGDFIPAERLLAGWLLGVEALSALANRQYYQPCSDAENTACGNERLH